MRIALFLVLMLSPALAQESAAPPPADAAPPPSESRISPAYTENTPVEKIAADPAAAAVIKKDLPGLLEDASYPIFKSMSLKQLQSASGGELSQQDVDKCVADLQGLFPH